MNTHRDSVYHMQCTLQYLANTCFSNKVLNLLSVWGSFHHLFFTAEFDSSLSKFPRFTAGRKQMHISYSALAVCQSWQY